MTHDFHPGAEDEYREAATWYEEQSSGLGTAFVAAVDAAILIIFRDPERFQKVEEGVRVFRLKRFPYYLYFGFDSVHDHLRFYGVVHHRKRPDYWRARVET